MGNVWAGVIPDNDQNININFDYNVDNKDHNDELVHIDNFQQRQDRGGDDRYDHEENMFAKGGVYKPDVELDYGFPDDRQEYDSFPCLEDVIDEYQSIPRARTLKSNVPSGLRQVFKGAQDFFKNESVGF